MAFHDVRFPVDIALGARGGPQWRTEIVSFVSGHEQRNQKWAHSRRRYDAGYGIKSVEDLRKVMAFFEERRGAYHSFRWRDPFDFNSSDGSQDVAETDQLLGVGDGVQTSFQLVKNYGGTHDPYTRIIHKPVATSVLVALDAVTQIKNTDFTLDAMTGIISFTAAPTMGVKVTAGFEFDVPVRFENDVLDLNMSHFSAGDIPSISLVEVR